MSRVFACVSIWFLFIFCCSAGFGDTQTDAAAVTSLKQKADFLHSQGRNAEAIIEYEKAIALATQIHAAEDMQTLICLNNLGNAYLDVGEYAKAETTHLRTLQLREAKLGKDHIHVALSLYSLASTYLSTNQFTKAEPLLQRALGIWEAKLGKDDPNVAMCLGTMGSLYLQTDRYSKAEPLLQRALEIQEAKLGKDHPELTATIDNLATTYRLMTQYEKAESLYLRALDIQEKKLGNTHPDIADTLSCLAILYQSMNQDVKAGPLLKRALDIKEPALGKDHPGLRGILRSTASLYMKTDEYDKAEPLLLRCMAISQKLPEGDLEMAYCLKVLAVLYTQKAAYDKAEEMYLRVLKLEDQKLGRDSLPAAETLATLGYLYRISCQYPKAEPVTLRALEITQTRLGKDAPETALALIRLGGLYMWMHQIEKAGPLLESGQEILERKLAKNDPRIGDNLGNLAELYKQMGNYAKATEMYRRCLEITEPVYGPDSVAVGITLNGLGETYLLTGELDKAQQAFERSLRIREAKLGDDHPRVAYELTNLAKLYAQRGDYAKAEELCRRALKILETRLGKEHFYLSNALGILTMAKAATGDLAEATNLCTRLLESRRSHAFHVLPSLSETEQIDYLQDYQQAFYTSMSLALMTKGDKSLTSRSTEWVINGKGILLDVLSERARQARASRDPQVRSKADELSATRSKLSKLVMDPSGDPMYRRQVGVLQAHEKELSKALGQICDPSGVHDRWINLNDIRASLPEDTVLIELARFPASDFAVGQERKALFPRYAAWVIPPANRGDITILDLGDADKIDEAVRCLHSLLSVPNPTPNETAGRLAGEVVTNVWEPIRQAIGSTPNLIISPDGLLWLMPWEVLPDNDKFLVETRRICYTVSGRTVIEEKRTSTASGAAIFADPDYDLDVSEALSETKRIIGAPAPAKPVGPVNVYSRRLLTGGCKRVPDSANAARAITPSLKAYTHADPNVLLGRQALEGVCKSLASPRVLVLITHGFCLEDQALISAMSRAPSSEPQQARSSASFVPRLMFENPLLRCGLALAAVNSRAQVPDCDDGLLMGAEVVGLDLPGTELVVLGACETGVGRLQNGEGVASLRQAFQLAGAKAVISTLWSVPVKETTELLPLFFDNLAAVRRKAFGAAWGRLARSYDLGPGCWLHAWYKNVRT